MHKLELTNGVRLLAHNLLHVPESFKTPSEILRAAKLIDLLACPTVTPEQATEDWQNEAVPPVELTEPQRDLLKGVVEKFASRLPPTKHVVSLLTQLGFE